MSFLPGAGTGQSKKVTGRALITFKLSSAPSPTSHLLCTTSHFAPKLDASLAIPSQAPRCFCACATSPAWAGRCLLCWHPWQGWPPLGSTRRSHWAPGSAPTAPLCASPRSTCATRLGCSFGLLGGLFLTGKGIKTSKHWAQSHWSSNKCIVGEQCFWIFLTAILVKHQNYFFFPDSNTNPNSTFKLWSQFLPDNRSCQGNQIKMEDRRMKYDIVSQALKIQSIFLTFFISLPSLQPFPELNKKQPFL